MMMVILSHLTVVGLRLDDDDDDDEGDQERAEVGRRSHYFFQECERALFQLLLMVTTLLSFTFIVSDRCR